MLYHHRVETEDLPVRQMLGSAAVNVLVCSDHAQTGKKCMDHESNVQHDPIQTGIGSCTCWPGGVASSWKSASGCFLNSLAEVKTLQNSM